MQISTKALMKLLLFIMASSKVVEAGVIPQSANPPACNDLAWDENDTGLQKRMCTIPHPFLSTGAVQSNLGKSSNNDIVDQFDYIFSSLMPEITEADINCAPHANTTSTPNEATHQAQSWNETSTTNIQRRGNCAARRLPYRSELVDHPDTSSKSWCFRPGPSPNNNDIASLCRNIAQNKHGGALPNPKMSFHDDFVVQRAKSSVAATNGNDTVEAGGSCVCVAGREKSAGFKICNCDTCDALVLNKGLADMCKILQEQCTNRGFSSGYVKSALRGSMGNSLISLFSYPGQKGSKGQPMELDPVLGEKGTLVGSCRSGDENRKGQDYSGPLIECREYLVGKFAGGRWCRDMVAGGERKWVKQREDPFEVLWGKPKRGFSQFGNK